jgi:REP element-mobilizing transposase RayT
MARPLRIEFEGAWYHVMNRGSGRQTVYKTDDQRRYFLSLLADSAERFNAEWHAYCLMGNHYHLLVRTPEGNLQRIMRHINGLYTQYHNRSQGCDGPLFRGRYKAILVDAQTYWTRLSRYIHRNPLEVGIVKDLVKYPWSSYPAYIGQQPPPDWLHCRYILNALTSRNAKARYQAYVEAGFDAEIQAFYGKANLAPVLADKDYIRRLIREKGLKEADTDVPDLKRLRDKPTLAQINAAVSRHLKVMPSTLKVSARGRAVDNPGRGMAMYLCQRESDMTLGEIAANFGLKNYTSAGSAIRQFQRCLEESSKLRKLIGLIKLDLTPLSP